MTLERSLQPVDCKWKSATESSHCASVRPTLQSYFFFTRVGLADKVGFFGLPLATETAFLLFPTFGVTFLAERGRPFFGFSADGFGPFVFPVNLVGNPDFFFGSWGNMAGSVLGIASNEDTLGILTIFFPAFPEPLPEGPVGGNGNEGSFFFFKASPEKTRT